MIRDRSKAELGQLAVDIRAGRVFHDQMCPKEQFDSIKMQDWPGLMYEYMDQAAERTVNGMPMFFSVKYLSKADTKRLDKILRRLAAAEKKVLK